MSRDVKGWSLLAVAVLAEVAGSLSLKGALDQPALYVLDRKSVV